MTNEQRAEAVIMDAGCMIDGEWADSLKGIENEYARTREEVIESFTAYYNNFEAGDEEW